MTEERLIIRRYVREPSKDDATGCYCPANKGFCQKFTGPSENFFKQNCWKCHVYGELHEQQELALKEIAAKKLEQEEYLLEHPKPKRVWVETESDGNIGAKAYE